MRRLHLFLELAEPTPAPVRVHSQPDADARLLQRVQPSVQQQPAEIVRALRTGRSHSRSVPARLDLHGVRQGDAFGCGLSDMGYFFEGRIRVYFSDGTG